jgi:hypothetical protein
VFFLNEVILYHISHQTFLKSLIIKVCNNMSGLRICKQLANWVGHVLRRNCLLRHVTERITMGRIEVTERRGRRHKKLLYEVVSKIFRTAAAILLQLW